MPDDISPLGVVGRLALYSLFSTAPRLLFDVEAHGLELDSGTPHSFYALMHKRDVDGMTPVPTLLKHRGWNGLRSDVHFALRSDAFDPGFLARMVPHPRWFSLSLRPISIGPLLRGVGVHPLRDLHSRPAEAWLREVLQAEGDQPTGDLLTSAYLSELAVAVNQKPESLARLPLSRLLGWRFHGALQSYYGPEIFAMSARRRAERRVSATAKAYLGDIAAWLRRGGSIVGGPEGRLSPDGHLSPVTGGMYRILRASPLDTRVVPIALVYDFMTTRRMRLFVDLAAPIENAATLSRQDLFASLRESWLRAARFTCTQLASGALAEYERSAHPVFTRDELASTVCAEAQQLVSVGRHVDKRLLDPVGAQRLVGKYLVFAEKHSIVRGVDRSGGYVTLPVRQLQVSQGAVSYRVAPLAYAQNELEELLSVS